eukprot:TRINITY_DN15227_c0_g1_i2.p1 TRINITY_DN15227_c0_g1~~TRINITY_DN15227_c0_g1_i2.p1  ORF type:complete len:332 (-),score=50.07 TRINITY_DN15227_c0_g1_i2:99-1094(-)
MSSHGCFSPLQRVLERFLGRSDHFFKPPASLRGFFGGSGKSMMGTTQAAEAVITLCGKEKPSVLYLGTPSYDIAAYRDSQIETLVKKGCKVTSLEVTRTTPSRSELTAAVAAADAILVSGGNTLFAVDRWRLLGLPDLLRQAMLRGAVLCGGSAGAVCWFDGGHSDSMDPASYLASPDLFTGEASNDASCNRKWRYSRVPGLGFLPGLICPHHDRVQSNGIARSVDLDEMMLRHRGEQAICIDHYAALIVEGDSYRVLSLPGENGSVLDNGTFSRDQHGKPGVWLKVVENGAVKERLLPPAGRLSDFLRRADTIVEDPILSEIRRLNPQPL